MTSNLPPQEAADELSFDSPLSSPEPQPDSPTAARPPISPVAKMSLEPPRLSSPRSMSANAAAASTASMTPSSTPLGTLNAARRPAQPPTFSRGGSGLNVSSDIQARMKAFHLGRQGTPAGRTQPSVNTQGTTPNVQATGGLGDGPSPLPSSPGGPLAGPGGIPTGFKLPPNLVRPQTKNLHSAPAIPGRPVGNKPSLAEKRGLALPGGLPGAAPNGTSNAPAPRRKKPGFTLSQMNGDNAPKEGKPNSPIKPTGGTMMDKYAEFLDQKTGSLKFKGKAVLTSQGVEFASGTSFSISLDEVDTLDELGKGNYGTVYKVRHSRPRIRRPGQGLAGNKMTSSMMTEKAPASPTLKGTGSEDDSSPISAKGSGGTGVIMAMKEIRLELDDAKFAAIIMELDVLHRCVSPYIIDFYGAFFQEGAVYICMEFMDGGSIDKLYGDGIPENVLRKITYSTTMGLKSLKDEHNIIHRDVKPTNILVNSRGQVKICDFGVSGNLVASIAKTNIGCQSYMAPERISSGGVAQAGANPGGGTYSVQSDIWSLGLSIIECSMGRYPYPPETYNNIFSQLSAIVDGEPPDLPAAGFSEAARDFVRGCLNKIPKLRPTYAMLLQHAWLAPLSKPETIAEEDEEEEQEETLVAGSEVSKPNLQSGAPPAIDKEVADWVVAALERRRNGTMGKAAKPALHAAPLDAVTSPALEKASANMA